MNKLSVPEAQVSNHLSPPHGPPGNISSQGGLGSLGSIFLRIYSNVFDIQGEGTPRVVRRPLRSMRCLYIRQREATGKNNSFNLDIVHMVRGVHTISKSFEALSG